MRNLKYFILILFTVFLSSIAWAQTPSLTYIPNWLKFPPAAHADWTWNEVVGTEFDSKGNLYVSSRGGTAPHLTVWKPDGTFLREFPAPKEFKDYSHYIEIDTASNDIVWWVLEGDCTIYKMDQTGKILMTLGTPGQDYDVTHNPAHFSATTDIAWDKSGNLYVSDGSGSQLIRVMKFDKDGKLLKTVGSTPGNGNL